MLERVSASQHREVLVDDGIRQRVHDLRSRDAGLHKVHDVRLGEHPALGGYVVQLGGSKRILRPLQPAYRP